MKFGKQILWTLVIQGGGALSVLGLVILLGAMLGPSAQGLFSRTKADLEFISALCLFGMPQAVFFFVSTGRLNAATALRITWALAAVAAVLALAYGGIAHSFRGIPLIAFAVASVFMVTHGVLRVLVLSFHDTRAFNAVTVLPQLILWPLGCLLIVLGSIQEWQISAAFAGAFFTASLSALWLVRCTASTRWETSENPVTSRNLIAYGGAAWSVAVLNSGSYVYCLRMIEVRSGLEEVGIFSMGIVLVQAVLTPFSYAAPLLFKRWVDNKPGRGASFRIAAVSAVGASLLAGSLIGGASLVSTMHALGRYSQLQELKWSFWGVAVMEAMIRTTAAISNAYGRPWIPALAEMLRLLVLGAALGFYLFGDLEGIVIIWLIATAFASVVILVGISKISASATVL